MGYSKQPATAKAALKISLKVAAILIIDRKLKISSGDLYTHG